MTKRWNPRKARYIEILEEIPTHRFPRYFREIRQPNRPDSFIHIYINPRFITRFSSHSLPSCHMGSHAIYNKSVVNLHRKPCVKKSVTRYKSNDKSCISSATGNGPPRFFCPHVASEERVNKRILKRRRRSFMGGSRDENGTFSPARTVSRDDLVVGTCP